MRTKLRSKVTLLFMVFALVLAIPAVAYADQLVADADALVLQPPDANALTATQAPGTTVAYDFSAYIKNNGGATDNVFPGSLDVTITRSGAWLDSTDGGSPSSFRFTSYDVPQPGKIRVTVPCTATAGAKEQMRVELVAGDSTNGEALDPANDSDHLIYNITAGDTPDASCPSTTPTNNAPTVTVTGVTNGAEYEFDSVPTAGCSVVDAEDGNSTFAATLSAITGPLSSYGLGSQTASCEYTDEGGLFDSDSVTYSIVDTTVPLLNITDPNTTTSFDVCGAAPQRPSFAPTDNVAVDNDTSLTFDRWTTPSSATGVGTYTYFAQATDVAGNDASETRTYNVAYGSSYGGVLQPINLGEQRSVFKLGSTIPIKFRLTCAGVPVQGAVATLAIQKVDPKPEGTVNEAVATTTGTTGTLFRYSDGQYIFNLSTKSGFYPINTWSAGTYKLIIGLDDNTTQTAMFDVGK